MFGGGALIKLHGFRWSSHSISYMVHRRPYKRCKHAGSDGSGNYLDHSALRSAHLHDVVYE